MKKTYIQPSADVVCLQHEQQLMVVSGVTTTSTSDDVDLGFDEGGGNAEDAW